MNVNQYSAERAQRDGGEHLLLGAQHSAPRITQQPSFGGGARHPGQHYNDVDNMNNNNIMVLNNLNYTCTPNTGDASERDGSGVQPGVEEASSYQ